MIHDDASDGYRRYYECGLVVRVSRMLRFIPMYVSIFAFRVVVWIVTGCPLWYPYKTRLATFRGIVSITRNEAAYAMGKWYTIDEVLDTMQKSNKG